MASRKIFRHFLCWELYSASCRLRLQIYKLEYRSKVSYHLSSRFSRDESLVSRGETLASQDETLVSRDETLVSREPLRRKVWNKFVGSYLARKRLISRDAVKFTPPKDLVLRALALHTALRESQL